MGETCNHVAGAMFRVEATVCTRLTNLSRFVRENILLKSFRWFEFPKPLLSVLLLKSLINKTLSNLFTAVSNVFFVSQQKINYKYNK